MQNPAENSVRKEVFPKLLKLLWDELAKDDNVNLQNGFTACFDRKRCIEKIPDRRSNDEIREAVGDSVITSFEKRRFVTVGTVSRKRTKLNKAPGKSLAESSDREDEDLEDSRTSEVKSGKAKMKPNKGKGAGKKLREVLNLDCSSDDASDNLPEKLCDDSSELSWDEGQNSEHEGGDNSTCKKDSGLPIKLSDFYAVFYEKDFYIGRTEDFPDEGMVKFKFMERVSNADFSYNWPKKGDVSVVEERYVFAGPLVRKGHGPFQIAGHREVTNSYKKLCKEHKF